MVFKFYYLVAMAVFTFSWTNATYAQTKSQAKATEKATPTQQELIPVAKTQAVESTIAAPTTANDATEIPAPLSEQTTNTTTPVAEQSADIPATVPEHAVPTPEQVTVTTSTPLKQLTARQVIESFQATLLDTMKQGKTLGFEGRYKKLNDPVLKSHDLAKIARIVLGKEWKKLNIEQKTTMIDLFTRLSVASYAYNFKDFSGEAFKYESEDQTSRGGIIVHTYLVLPDDKDVKFDYMMKNKGDSWRIINIIANGVSDLALKRSEYTSILKREGFDALLAKISSKIDKYSMQ